MCQIGRLCGCVAMQVAQVLRPVQRWPVCGCDISVVARLSDDDFAMIQHCIVILAQPMTVTKAVCLVGLHDSDF